MAALHVLQRFLQLVFPEALWVSNFMVGPCKVPGALQEEFRSMLTGTVPIAPGLVTQGLVTQDLVINLTDP